jgi:N-acetylmuramoyl-L-alanine amidase
MREINRIIIHCTATPPTMDIGVEEIRKWHTDQPPKGRGWSDIGYHYVIRINGEVEVGRPLERIGAHTKGENRDSIGIAYCGGSNADGEAEDTMFECQEEAMRELIHTLRMGYEDRHITLHGHNEFADKECPSFKVSEKFRDIL